MVLPTFGDAGSGPSPRLIAFAVVGYMACSSLMLLSNKVAVHFVPAPSFLLWLQLFSTALGVFVLAKGGVIECDALEGRKALQFCPVAMIFLGTIFTNMKTLQHANVETFIVFRASAPLFISVCDWACLGRQLPSRSSLGCLCGLALCAVLYCLNDSYFEVKGYAFVAVWLFIFTLDQVYLKHVTNTVRMKSNWGRVLYTNGLASVPLVALAYGTAEQAIISDAALWTAPAIASVAVSIVLGVAMSYFAWLARSLVSATYFTVIGNTCKLITVLANLLIWDKHASNAGLVCLLGCLGAAYFYKQAPMRHSQRHS